MPNDRELARRLQNFNAVWQRVARSRNVPDAAASRGVKLMPRGRCCRRGRR